MVIANFILFCLGNCCQINGVPYRKLELIGRGGSSKVYKVLAPNNRILAVKKVKLAREEEPVVIQGYKDEIALLSKLKGQSRIIELKDAAVSDSMIFMVCYLIFMQFVNVIPPGDGVRRNGFSAGSCKTKTWSEYDPSLLGAGKFSNMINLYLISIQMLEAVQAIHNENIVHSDLKPAVTNLWLLYTF